MNIEKNMIEECPVARPSMKEFLDFQGYIQTLEKKYGGSHGMVKIVPPAGWKGTRSFTQKELDSIVLKGPIEQNAYGRGGVYELLLIQKKSLTVAQYKKKVKCFENITNGKTVEQIEELFWKNISYSPPLYGADMNGTLMEKNVPWNLAELPNLLSKCLKQSISGVNQPYLYVGSWKTLFGWHKEDLDLYSINFLHMGKPKFWYCIPREDERKLENIARMNFPESFQKCGEYMRHKVIAMNPYYLKKVDPSIRISKIVHHPNEFVVTFGGTYHQGFNWGLNYAEAVNFATDNWLGLLLKANTCKCHRDSVKIDSEEIFQNLKNTEYGKTDLFKMFLKARQSRSSQLIQKLIDLNFSEPISRDVSIGKSNKKNRVQKENKEYEGVVKSIKKRFRKPRQLKSGRIGRLKNKQQFILQQY